MRPWPGGAPTPKEKNNKKKNNKVTEEKQTHNKEQENELINNKSEGDDDDDDDDPNENDEDEYYSGDFTKFANLHQQEQQQVIVPFDNFSTRDLKGNGGRMVVLEIVGGLLIGSTTGIAGRWLARGQRGEQQQQNDHPRPRQRHGGLFRLRFHHGRLILVEPPALMSDQKKSFLEHFPTKVQEALREYSKTCTVDKIDFNSKGKCYEFSGVSVIPHVEHSTVMEVVTTTGDNDTTEQHNTDDDAAVEQIIQEQDNDMKANDNNKGDEEALGDSSKGAKNKKEETATTTTTPTTPVPNSPSTVVVSFDMVSTTQNENQVNSSTSTTTQENKEQHQDQQQPRFWRLRRRQGRNVNNNNNEEKEQSLLEDENSSQKEEKDHQSNTTSTGDETRQQRQRHWFQFWNHQKTNNGNEQPEEEDFVQKIQIPPALHVEKLCVEWDDYMKPCFSLLVKEVHYTLEFLTHPPHLKSNWDELKLQGFPPLIPHIPYVIGNIILQGNLYLNVRSRLYQRNLFSETYTMEDLEDLFQKIESHKNIPLGQQKGITPIDLADLLEEYFKRKVLHLWKQQPQQREERLLRGSGVVQPVVLEEEKQVHTTEHRYREDAIKFVKDATKTVAAAAAVPMDAISEALPLPEGHHYRQDAADAVRETGKVVAAAAAIPMDAISEALPLPEGHHYRQDASDAITKTGKTVMKATATAAAVAAGFTMETKKEGDSNNNNHKNTNDDESKESPSDITNTKNTTAAAVTTSNGAAAVAKAASATAATTSTSSSTKQEETKKATMLEVVSMPIDAISKALPLPEGHHYRQDAADFAKETSKAVKQFVSVPITAASSAFATPNNTTANGSCTQKATSVTTTFNMTMPTSATAKEVKKGLTKPLKAFQRTVTK